MPCYLRSLLRGFRGDRRGAVALLFGLTLAPTLVGVGLGVDYSRAQALRKHLNHALDAAALAVGTMRGLEQGELQARAQDYFDANFKPAAGMAEGLSLSVDGPRITVTVEGHVKTAILGLIGIDKVDVSARAEVTVAQKKIELALALDNTGSMATNGKIGALRDAARIMVDMLFEGDDEAEFVKIGLAPFASAVNIGADAPPAWIDTGALSEIASEDFDEGVNALDLFDEISDRAWNGCVRARIAPYDVRDTPPSPENPATLWAPYFAPDEPDIGYNYLNRYANDGDYDSSYYDYDARQRHTGKYDDLTVSGPNGPDFNCQTRPLTPLTNVKATLDSAVGAMNAVGSTVIPAGLAWGWRLVSPGEPFTEGAPYDDEDTVKAIVLLTDGRNDIGGGMNNHNRSFYSAYGYAQSGHLGASHGGGAEDALDGKTAALCEAIKAEGIKLYTVTFQLSNGPIKTLMRDCATKPEMYYDSPTNAQLQSVFEEIAKGLNKLRLSR